MYELKRLGENTYYIDCPTRIGIYKITENEVCIIDSGNDKEAGKKVRRILEENQWNLKMIINTHSHADHIGANQYLQEYFSCPVYTYGIDEAFVRYPILEPSFLYGGYPCKELKNKFLLASKSHVEPLTPDLLPEGLEMLPLNGHTFSMVGIRTKDNVWFLGDSVASQETMQKYHVFFLYDIKTYLESLEEIDNLEGTWFVPSHAEPQVNIQALVEKNRVKVMEIANYIMEVCKLPMTFETLLKQVFDHYDLHMNVTQYVLVGSTIRSYLTYLKEEEKLVVEVQDNQLLWKRV